LEKGDQKIQKKQIEQKRKKMGGGKERGFWGTTLEKRWCPKGYSAKQSCPKAAYKSNGTWAVFMKGETRGGGQKGRSKNPTPFVATKLGQKQKKQGEDAGGGEPSGTKLVVREKGAKKEESVGRGEPRDSLFVTVTPGSW